MLRRQAATGKAGTELLDHLDEVTEYFFRATLQSPRGDNVKDHRTTQAFLSGKYHWTILERQEEGGKPYGCGDNFLSWAVQANLQRYLEEDERRSEEIRELLDNSGRGRAGELSKEPSMVFQAY